MPHFFFDLHSDSLSTWDDDGQECAGTDEILRHALRLLNTLPETDLGTSSHAVVSVRDDHAHVVLTVTHKPHCEPRLRWSEKGHLQSSPHPQADHGGR